MLREYLIIKCILPYIYDNALSILTTLLHDLQHSQENRNEEMNLYY